MPYELPPEDDFGSVGGMMVDLRSIETEDEMADERFDLYEPITPETITFE